MTDDRVTLVNATGRALGLTSSASPRPTPVVPPGAEVTVDAWAVPSLLGSGRFVAPRDEDAVLRGEALDARLDELGLPKTGTADEKRARVAEHDNQEEMI